MVSYDYKIKYAKLGNWNLLEKLGTGATASVYLAYDPTSKKYSAIKVIKKITSSSIAMVKNESKLQAKLNHPHILAIREFYKYISLTDARDTIRIVTAIVLEYANGSDLIKLIQTLGAFSDCLARTYFHQLIDAIDYLHKNEIAHRDIKLENILLDEDHCLKLADFGCAILDTDRKFFKNPVGTSAYFPPEIHLGLEYEGKAMDLYAAGIILFSMMIGHMPFSKACNRDYFYSYILRGKYALFWKKHKQILIESQELKRIPLDFCDLINKMLDADPNKRLSIEEIKKSSWYNGPVLERSEIIEAINSIGRSKNSA